MATASKPAGSAASNDSIPAAPVNADSKLFKPIRIGNCHLHHRIAMAPLTRYRADQAHVPLLPLVPTYYAQRASVPGTLLISEAIFISPAGGGMDHVPGLWNPAQLAHWRHVTHAVHAQGGFLWAQLWCLGRAASRRVLARQGLEVLSSGDVGIGARRPTPRPMTEEEIWSMVGAYAMAARNAVFEAGFDGVEIHAANGYMVDQFTQDTCNNRTDQWGGSIENRARFALEVATAVAAAVGPERTGIRLSPYSEFQAMRMADPVPQFTYLIDKLSDMKLAYLHLTTPRVNGPIDVKVPVDTIDWAIAAWKSVSPVILAGGYRADTAQQEVDEQYRDYDILIAFGRLYIASPDLPYRVRQGLPLSKYDRSTFYTPFSSKGYTDYPFSEEWNRLQSRL